MRVRPQTATPSARLALVLLGCFVCQMGLGCGYVFGATLKHIVAEFEWSRAAFSAASAPLLAAMALSAPLLGAAAERIGARTVLSASALALGIALYAFSRMTNLWVFYATSVVFGVALTGLGDVVVGSVAAQWTTTRRGLVLALVYVGSNVGGAVVPIAADLIADAYSWRTALAVIGIAASTSLLPFALFAVRERTAVHDPAAGSTAGMHAHGTAGSQHDGDLDLRAALRTRTFWILAVVLFSFYFYYLAVNQHLIAYLSDIGFSNARAAASLSFAVALGILAKLGMGLLADRIAIERAAMLNFGLLTAASVLLLGAATPRVLTLFLIAHGFATAAENVLLPMLVAQSFGVTHMAKIYGALMVALLPGGVLGPVFAGAVFDSTGNYTTAFTAFAALNMIGLLALGRIRCERDAVALTTRPLGTAARG